MRRLFRLPLRSPARIQSDADDELASFLDARSDDLVARGLSPAEARDEALRRLATGETLEATRARLRRSAKRREERVRVSDFIDEISHDVQFAVRQLVRTPGFTVVAVLSLALGIGATSAIFSVVYSVLLRPLPFAHAERLVSLRERNGRDDTQGMVVTAGNYGSWLALAHDFEALAAYGYGSATLTGAGEPQSLQLLRASAGYWKAMYLPPTAGRYFGADEDHPGAPAVIVISQHLWQSAFGSDPRIVGRDITLGGRPYTVIGVAPAEYALAGGLTDAWIPLALSASQLAEHSDHEYAVVGLVRQGVPQSRAIDDLTTVETSLAHEYPGGFFDGGIITQPLSDAVVGSARQLLLILLGAVLLVLLIACSNISSLLLARAGARETEIAVRGALGAGHGRIVRQLLAESLVLAMAGAVIGLAVAAAGLRFLVTMTPQGSVPRLDEASLNAPVLAFTIAIALGCGIVFGLYPALRAANPELQQLLREGSRGTGGGMGARLREALVIAEVAIALVLLVAAGLLVRSAMLVQRVDPGFDPANVLVAGISLPDARYQTDDARRGVLDRIASLVGAVPGVAQVAMVSRIPIGDGGFDCRLRAEGADERAFIIASVRSASPDFPKTMRVPLVAGRFFSPSDVAAGPPVAVLTRSLAHRLFGEADPVGRRVVDCTSGSTEAPLMRTVVGVIGDMHANGLQRDPTNEIYVPIAQVVLEHSMKLLVLGSVAVTSLVPAIRRAVAAVDPLLPLARVRTMDEIVARSLAVSRFTTLLLLSLGGMGLTLAVIGIYGVIAYFVAQRRREIGVRIALGATAGRVVRLVVREGVTLAVIGVAVGCAAALALSRAIGSLLYEGVSARDPLTIISVALLIALVAACASAIPAWRAARTNPTTALRT